MIRGTLASLVLVLAAAGVLARAGEPLVLVGSIALPHVEGRIDHLAADAAARRLYVAALGNDTVEVLDLAAARHARSVRGFKEPQGIGVVPEPPQVVVANGQGTGAEFRAPDDLRLVRSVALGDDSDNVRVDAQGKRVYVGYGDGAIAAIDASSGRKVADVSVGGHPESFQLEPTPGTRLFVNVPSAHHVSVVDRTQMKVVATWPVTEAASNYPMALDGPGHRLFIGCRRPAVVLILDAESGRQIGSAAIAADTDDLFWDVKHHRLYVSAGEGFIDVLQAEGSGLRRTARIPTAAGARTSLFVPALDRLYLAVPHRGRQAAEIRIYETRD